MKRWREREERAGRERKFSEASWLLFFRKDIFFFIFPFFTWHPHWRQSVALTHINIRGARLKLLSTTTTKTTLSVLKSQNWIYAFKRKNTQTRDFTLFETNKNVEQTHIKPRGRRVGKKRLPSRVRRLSRPEPVRENAERKLRRGVRHLGKTVHGVPMATRTRREV